MGKLKISITVDAELLAQIDWAAREVGATRSGVIGELCRAGLARAGGGIPSFDVEDALRYIGSAEFYDSFLTHLHEQQATAKNKNSRRKES